MRRAWLLTLILFSFLPGCVILIACSTIQRAGEMVISEGWSSADPLSIPYDTRRAQFEKGNLVINPSFEKGRQGAGKNFRLNGWQPVGTHVRWTQQPSGDVATREINSGSRAVKIVRNRAEEADTADGIISNYLPVIPGNYDFTFNIRLKGIASNTHVQGLNGYDALKIRVWFFDRHKQRIESEALIPGRETPIDNSDKNYTLSFFREIKDLPWSTVRGKSFTYPFSEGDIPDEARFVRLFLGLNGTGTMWIDDIDYRYSKWNFTALERFQPLFARPLTLAEKITPTPKSFQRLSDVVYVNTGDPNTAPPLIVLPENPAPAETTAAALLRAKLETFGPNMSANPRPEVAIVQTPGEGFETVEAATTRLVFSIGRNRLFRQLQPDLPLQFIRDKNQGYVIKSQRVGNNHIVFLIGQTPLANYFAATTAAQLIDNDQGIYQDAAVIDYPDFLSRGFALKRWRCLDEIQRDLDNVEEMSRFKLNKVYIKYTSADKNSQHPNPVYLRGIQQAGKRRTGSGVMSLAMQVNPYAHFDFFPSVESLSEDERYLWTHSNPASLTVLRDLFKIGLDAGADTLMFRADDRVPHTGKNSQNYTLYTIEDKNRFVNLQNAQAHIINRLKKWIDSDYPGTRFEFCPPWYSNDFVNRADGQAETYFRELRFQIPSDVAIVWTGPAVRSLSIDMADIRRFRDLTGSWPMVWDNTLYARSIEREHYGGYTAHYPGKVRMCNLFEPFDTHRPENFHRYSSGGHIYINANAYRDTYKAKLATVADYLWNTSAYNPELSMWKVLSQTYGTACARELIYFNDAYYGLYQICLRFEAGEVRETYTDEAMSFIEAMAGCLQQIEEADCAGQTLLQELEGLKDRLEKRFEDLAQQ